MNRQCEKYKMPSQDDVLLPQAVEPSTDPCTDVANTLRFCKLTAQNLIFVDHMGWYKWDGIWIPDDLEPMRVAQHIGKYISVEAGQVSALAACEDDLSRRKGLEREAESLNRWARISEGRTRIDAVIQLARPHLSVQSDRLDADPWVLATENGSLDLHTGELKNSRRDDLITKRSNVEYQADATCPLWERTLGEVFAHDLQLINYIQRVFGYCLTGSVKEQVIFIAHGGGANGKNTIIGAVMKALGPYAVQAAPNLLMKSRNERHPTELHDLRGTRMTVASETAESKRMDESLVKSLTGDDFIKARQMRKDFIEFKPTHKLLLLTNYKPVIEGNDYAIWRRIHLIPFTQTFSNEKRDLDLSIKLESELPGILRWCVKGCLEWQRIGLQPPSLVREATKRYKSEQDVFKQFLDEHCQFEINGQVKASAFNKKYKTWCQDTGNDPKSLNWVWERLQEREVTKKRTSKGYYYYGLDIRRM